MDGTPRKLVLAFLVFSRGKWPMALMTLHLRELLSGAMSIDLAQCCSCGVGLKMWWTTKAAD